MNEEAYVEQLWTRFKQENPDGTMMEFFNLVSQQLNCGLQEAKEHASHLFLSE